MNSITQIPELIALDSSGGGHCGAEGGGMIRIPDQIDVPVSQRVTRIIDTAEFQRLKSISQLGLVSTVYPAAKHDRFEHSLGVYRMCLLVLRQLAHSDRFTEMVTVRDCHALILAALLHDVGHWPFCHPIEDLKIPGIAEHESFAAEYLRSEPLNSLIQQDWQVSVEDVIGLLMRKKHTPTQSVLSSILSGPIDIDKMDYLYRDSLHSGVPYGKNFDTPRLISSLCLNTEGNRIAITHKGKTAAELMVFARYVMFSEVYWHHTVRSATAMFQRAFYLWHQNVTPSESDLASLFRMGEQSMVAKICHDVADQPAASLLDGIFGPRRKLYKRLASYSYIQSPDVFARLARQPYPHLVECSRRLAQELSNEIGATVSEPQILFDAPPVGLEVQFNIDVVGTNSQPQKLGDISPVVQTLAQEQFDNYVKQVRVFIAPELSPAVQEILPDKIQSMIARSIA